MMSHFEYADNPFNFRLVAKVINIETNFLYQELEEEIDMEYPLGMKDLSKDDCIILKKCIYGSLQAARQYDNKDAEISKKISFTRGIYDPWLYIKQCTKSKVHITFYINNNLMIGNPEVIDEVVKLLQENGLVLKAVN